MQHHDRWGVWCENDGVRNVSLCQTIVTGFAAISDLGTSWTRKDKDQAKTKKNNSMWSIEINGWLKALCNIGCNMLPTIEEG